MRRKLLLLVHALLVRAAVDRGDEIGLQLGDKRGDRMGESARASPGGELIGQRSSVAAAGES